MVTMLTVTELKTRLSPLPALLRLLEISHSKVKQSGGELYPVKVVERGSELVHLLLTDAFGISGQDLGLNLVDGSSDGCEEQLPPNANMLLMWRQNRYGPLAGLNNECLKNRYLNVGVTMYLHMC